jgi:hypothetical protein
MMKHCMCLLSLLLMIMIQSITSTTQVHLVSHSHVDHGWLKTMEEYQQSKVNTIIDNVIKDLCTNLNYRFTWTETLFFKRWYNSRSDVNFNDTTTMHQCVHHILHNTNQLEFVGGGYVQHDETLTLYSSMVNQMRDGLQWLREKLNIRPRIAWQNDCFGHSSVTPHLFSSLQYDAVILNRIPSPVKQRMRETKELEFYWKGPYHRNALFTHILHHHYNPPEDFDFEHGLTSTDVPELARKFVTHVNEVKEYYIDHGHVLFLLGDDFRFYSKNQFKAMDQIMKYINENFNNEYNIQYSRLDEYIYAVKEAVTVSKYHTDFIPYVDQHPFDYWSGFFSSRSRCKQEIRKAESLYTAAKVVYSLVRNEQALKNLSPKMEECSENIAIVQVCMDHFRNLSND